MPIIQVADITKAIGTALQQEFERITEEETEAIVARVRQRAREAATNIAAKCCERMTFDMMGQELIIRVEFKDVRPQ